MNLSGKLKKESCYLGDGVYAYYDGYHIMLFTSDGVVVNQKIFLDPDTLNSFLNYAKRFKNN